MFRFPGGCIVEGTELKDRYNWKNSIGPVEKSSAESEIVGSIPFLIVFMQTISKAMD
nr:CAZy families GH51 protein [uncultured Bacteroides sp.]